MTPFLNSTNYSNTRAHTYMYTYAGPRSSGPPTGTRYEKKEKKSSEKSKDYSYITNKVDEYRVLYKKFPNIKGIAHAHPTFLTSWAQTGKSIPNI